MIKTFDEERLVVISYFFEYNFYEKEWVRRIFDSGVRFPLYFNNSVISF